MAIVQALIAKAPETAMIAGNPRDLRRSSRQGR
jgi:hypothetical protein